MVWDLKLYMSERKLIKISLNILFMNKTKCRLESWEDKKKVNKYTRFSKRMGLIYWVLFVERKKTERALIGNYLLFRIDKITFLVH